MDVPGDRGYYYTPNENDVLCGRGLDKYRHPGNCKLRELVFENLAEWKRTKRFRNGKTILIRKVIDSVFHDGGKFLQYDKDAGKWYDGGLQAGKNRVGIAFRDASTPNKVKHHGIPAFASIPTGQKEKKIQQDDYCSAGTYQFEGIGGGRAPHTTWDENDRIAAACHAATDTTQSLSYFRSMTGQSAGAASSSSSLCRPQLQPPLLHPTSTPLQGPRQEVTNLCALLPAQGMGSYNFNLDSNRIVMGGVQMQLAYLLYIPVEPPTLKTTIPSTGGAGPQQQPMSLLNILQSATAIPWCPEHPPHLDPFSTTSIHKDDLEVARVDKNLANVLSDHDTEDDHTEDSIVDNGILNEINSWWCSDDDGTCSESDDDSYNTHQEVVEV